MCLDAGLTSKKTWEKLFLLGSLMLSSALLNMGSGDADLGQCSHQLTFSRAQKRYSWGIKVMSLSLVDASRLNEV